MKRLVVSVSVLLWAAGCGGPATEAGTEAASGEAQSTAAAEGRPAADLLPLYRRIQEGCVTCHAAFRDRVSRTLAGM